MLNSKRKWWLLEQTQDGEPGEGAPPAAEPTPEEPEDTEGYSQDFRNFLDEEDTDILPESGAEPEAPTPPPVRQATPAEPPGTPPQGNAPSTQAPSSPTAPEPTAPRAAEGTPPAQEPPADPAPAYTPEQVAEFRKRYLAELEKGYALSEADATAMQTEPETVLPRIAAQLHLQVTENAIRNVMSQLPQVVAMMNQATTTEAAAKNEFFSTFPGLAQHEKEVLRVGSMFRAANPHAPRSEAIERIGAMTAMALGLDVNSVRNASAEAPSVPAQATPTPQPRRPVGVGGGGGAPPPTQSDNIFTQFAEEAVRGRDDDF